MTLNPFILSYASSSLDDHAISSVILVILVICLIIVIAGIVWLVLINRKTNKTTVVTITNEDEFSAVNQTVIEDFEQIDNCEENKE